MKIRLLGSLLSGLCTALVLPVVISIGTVPADAAGMSSADRPAVGASAPELVQPSAPGKLVVSLTFDDGYDNQLAAAETMKSYGLNGTFYVNSARLGTSQRLTWSALDRIRDLGNEIGGHTSWHSSLPSVNRTEQLREVCGDRVKLTRKGFDVTDFAYPFGAHDAGAAGSVAACGYNSARVVGGLSSDACPQCQPAGPLIPSDPLAIPALPSVVDSSDPKSIIEELLAAQRHGGWAVLVFHDICDGCSPMGFPPEKFRALLKWLRVHESAGIEVRTVQAQLQLPTKPTVEAPPPPSVEAKLMNGDLGSVVDVGGEDGVPPGPLPVCWDKGGYGDNTATWSRRHDRALGAWTESVRLSNHRSGDAKLIVQMGSGGCAPAVVADRSYRLGASYRSTVPARFVVFALDADGTWRYFGASPTFGASDQWATATWTTPEMPKTVRRLALLSIAKNGELTTARYTMARDMNPPISVWVWLIGLVFVVGELAAAIVRAHRRKRIVRATGPRRAALRRDAHQAAAPPNGAV